MTERSATIAGLGNIGSQLSPLIARLGFRRLVLVDPDCYDTSNFASQNIVPTEVGRPKAHVQAERVRSIEPQIAIETHVCRIEQVPIALLRTDVIFACVDSRLGRQSVNRIAWRLGVPWIDSAVDAGFGLARVTIFIPGDGSCIECGWSDMDYALLEVTHPCNAPVARLGPTRAPAHLGALAAAMQIAMWERLVAGRANSGARAMIHTKDLSTMRTQLSRNPACRFDHHTWQVERLPGHPTDLTVRDLLGHHIPLTRARLRVDNDAFSLGVVCVKCNRTRPMLYRTSLLEKRACDRCDGDMFAPGHMMRDELGIADLGPANPTLTNIGVTVGDVVTVSGPSHQKHYVIGC